MIAEWLGLMSDYNFGGVVSFLGAFPLREIGNVSERGKEVPIFHPHDVDDIIVLFSYAAAGRKAAADAGARGYEALTPVSVNGSTHHGLSAGTLVKCREWLEGKMSERNLIN